MEIIYPYKVHKLLLSNGCDLAYVDEGKGDKTIIFIHGLATYALSWKKNIEYLKQYYRCISIDLPGNGLSGRGNYPYGISFFASCVQELIEKLSLKGVCVIGHSMGGQVAMRLAIDHPQYIQRLILCAPAGFETFNGFESAIYKSTVHLLDFFSTEENSLRKVIRSSFYHVPPHIEDMVADLVQIMRAHPVQDYRRMIEACINSMLNEPVHDQLHQIKTPTLIVYGERDALIPNRLIHPITTRHIAEHGAKKITDAQLIMLPQCGHFLQIEKADEVNRYFKDFIEA
jgi:pimeloyl-ACP methyl ester carboxylesterase